MSNLSNLQFKISSARAEVTGWKFLWCKNVTGFKPDQHCARCFTGSYVKAFGLKAFVNEDVPLEGYVAGSILYFCGVSKPYRWERNMHLAVCVTDKVEDEASVEFYNGDKLTVRGAVAIPFSAKIAAERYPHLDNSYLTCRNFQFGAEMAAKGFLEKITCTPA